MKEPLPRSLIALIFLALVLRAIGLAFGLNHPDEHLIVNHSLAFGTGDFNPHMFYFPTLFLYMVFSVFAVFYLGGLATGLFSNPGDLLNLFFRSPETFYLAARGVSVFFWRPHGAGCLRSGPGI